MEPAQTLSELSANFKVLAAKLELSKADSEATKAGYEADLEALRSRIADLESAPGASSDPALITHRRFAAADPSAGFSVEECAALTGYSRSTLNTMRTRGWPSGDDLKFVKRGSKIIYLAGEIRRWMGARKLSNTAQAGHANA